MQEEPVSLDRLAGGAAAELFADNLDRVVKNILDPNTPATSKRTITLRVVIEPEEDRSMGKVGITCEAKLAGTKGAKTTLYFGRQQGKAVAVENDPRQAGLFDSPKPIVVPMPGQQERSDQP